MTLLIVLPTYNERLNIERVVAEVMRHEFTRLLVVDDESPDDTGALADALALQWPGRIEVFHRRGPRGLGLAYVDGLTRAIATGADAIGQMDADLSHDPLHFPVFLRALEEGADVVSGSRNIPGGGVRGWGVARHVLSKGGSLYARAILGVPVRDLTTGFKAFTRRALEALDIGAIRSNGYSFQIETTYRALRRGLRVVEVPIVFVDRRAGHSKMSRRIFAEAVLEVWRLRLDAERGRL